MPEFEDVVVVGYLLVLPAFAIAAICATAIGIALAVC